MFAIILATFFGYACCFMIVDFGKAQAVKQLATATISDVAYYASEAGGLTAQDRNTVLTKLNSEITRINAGKNYISFVSLTAPVATSSSYMQRGERGNVELVLSFRPAGTTSYWGINATRNVPEQRAFWSRKYNSSAGGDPNRYVFP